MKIGILREEKVPTDKRVPLSPCQCKQLIAEYPSIGFFVQSSHIRCFTDEEYKDLGINIVEDISLTGAGIVEQGYFHFGFTSWCEEVNSTILSFEIF